MNKYVIIGGGVAAIGCIEGIRSVDKEGKICVLSKEKYKVYARPLISYYLENKTTLEKMQYRPEKFYDDNDVEFLCSKEAVKIDGKKVVCSDGSVYEFDKLLVAAGSSPFIPPFKGLDSVKKKFTFMTVDDALSIEKAVNENSRVLIVGAGLIGLKCGEGLKEKVKKITVCDLADRVLSSILDEECASVMQKKLEENSFKFMLGDSVSEFEGNTALMKSGKKVEFDVLILAVGVRANTSLIKDAGGEVNRGVAVNDKMETSLKDIYAAGDLAEGEDVSSGTKKIMAILPNAYSGGLCAGVNMAGGNKLFNKQIPMNSIGLFGFHIMSAGTYDGEEIVEKDGENLKKFFVKNNRLLGFIMMGKSEKTGIYTALIKNRTELDSIDFESMKKNPSFLHFSSDFRRKNFGGVV